MIKIDATHDIHFTQYRHLFPERNYFAAIISLQTSLIAQYFERQGEDLDAGALSLDAYGAEIYLDNLTGRLTYAMAHRMLGELGEFLMGGYRCVARFELWETQGAQAEQLSVGWLEPEDTNKNAKVVNTEEAARMKCGSPARNIHLKRFLLSFHDLSALEYCR